MYKYIIILTFLLLEIQAKADNAYLYNKIDLEPIMQTEQVIDNLKNDFLSENNLSQKAEDFEKDAKRVAKELQDILAFQMLKQIHESIEPDKIFGGGSAERTYQSLLNQERAKLLDLGLVEPIKKQIINIKKGQNIWNNNK